jgi:hypothetical protein
LSPWSDDAARLAVERADLIARYRQNWRPDSVLGKEQAFCGEVAVAVPPSIVSVPPSCVEHTLARTIREDVERGFESIEPFPSREQVVQFVPRAPNGPSAGMPSGNALAMIDGEEL